MNIYIDITIASLTGAASGGLVYYFTKTYFTERIKQSIKHEYDDKLENIKGDISKNHSILNSILTSQNQTYQVGQNERLTAIKSLWTNYLTIRNSLDLISTWDDVLLEEEFDTLFTDKWKGNELVNNSLKSISLDKLSELGKCVENIEASRPFLNEQIWVNIIYLRTFCGRIIYLYHKGRTEKKIKHWKHDTALIKVVKESLTEIEFKFIMSANIATAKAYRSFIEQKILIEIHNIITGQMAADNTYNQAVKLTELIKNTK